MTLNEFAALCERHPNLAPLWELVFSEAHKLVSSKVRAVFFGDENKPETAFLQAKEALEKACSSAGVEYPDLSFKEFKNWILKY